MKLKTLFVAVQVALGALALRRGFVAGALAVELDEAAFTKLPDGMKGAYVKQTDGKYKLDFEVEDTKGLKNALASEREKSKAEEKARKELERRWEGLDPDEIRKMVEKLGGDEESQLIKAGKIDEVVARRTERQRLAHEKALKAEVDKAAKAEARATKFTQRVLDDAIRAAAGKAGIHANAIDDALFRGRSIFSLNEEGEAVQMKAGEVVMGKDGKTAFTPTEWLESMKESAPHWFPSGNTGSGAQNTGKQNIAGRKTMTRAAFDQMEPQAKSDFMVKDKGVLTD